MDEPTANLDVEAEAEVMHAIDTLVVGRTVLMISHRLTTLGHVDQIVVLHEGRIIERGTLDELQRAGGRFATMLAEQNRYVGKRTAEMGAAAITLAGDSLRRTRRGSRTASGDARRSLRPGELEVSARPRFAPGGGRGGRTRTGDPQSPRLVR